MILFVFIACNKNTDSFVLAIIGNTEITLEEFRDFYNFDVNFAIDSTGLDALKDELMFLIAQTSAWEKCKKNGLIDDEIFLRASKWEKRQAMLRQLYRKKVLNKIEISEEELRNQFIAEKAQVHLKHLYYNNLNDAVNAKNEIDNGASFNDIAKNVFNDTTLANSGGDLGWLLLSELEQEFGTPIHNLIPGRISEPIKSKWGYHLVEVLNKKENPIISESDFQIRKPSLQKKIRQRKAQNTSANYINNFIGELNPQLNKRMFKDVWDCIIPKDEKEKSKLSREISLSYSEISKIKIDLSDKLNKPFINYNKGESISLGKFLTGIEKIPMGQLFRFDSQRKLSNDIGRWVRDEILLREALDLELNINDRVLSETRRFMEEQSFYYFHGLVMDTLSVPQHVLSFYQNKNKKKDQKKEGSNPKYHTLQEWKFECVKRKLIKNLVGDKKSIWINNTLLEKENGEIDWDNKIRMFMIRKQS